MVNFFIPYPVKVYHVSIDDKWKTKLCNSQSPAVFCGPQKLMHNMREKIFCVIWSW